MINKDTVFAVIGLGVLGGSYVEGLSQKGYSCIGVDINEESIAYAKEKGWIVKGGNNPSIVKEADIVISELSAEGHDKMIGFLSQLTHVIAVSLMNVTDNEQLVDYTGDSFRDLTRIAEISESMWPELFVENKDYLLKEITAFQQSLENLKEMIETENYDGMKNKMIIATERRKKFNK